MRRALLVLTVLAIACGPSSVAETTSTGTPTTAPSTTVGTTSTTVPSDCPPPPYRVGELPERVGATEVPAENLELDAFTSIPGTSSTLWVDGEGSLAVALVRGALPPEVWPGDVGDVSIDGVRARVGPFEDGRWVVAWFEEPRSRCDLYTMVFYPPVEATEVQRTLESMDRTAG